MDTIIIIAIIASISISLGLLKSSKSEYSGMGEYYKALSKFPAISKAEMDYYDYKNKLIQSDPNYIFNLDNWRTKPHQLSPFRFIDYLDTSWKFSHTNP